jgi:S-adenosylmethionine hydrolase
MTSSPDQSPVITLLTDFGIDDAYVGIMKGVVLGINARARLVDLTHSIPPQEVMRAALALRSAVEFFPPGTIHVAVVDPGVGSDRRPLLLRTERACFVGPDNGVLVAAARRIGKPKAYVLENSRYFRPTISQTFHGRDIFAPVAAHLSLGVEPADVGRETSSFVHLDLPEVTIVPEGIQGEVIYVDRFGNLITNIERTALDRFPGPSLSVSIGSMAVTGPVQSYAAVDEGTALALIGSWGVLEIAIRNGDAARDLGMKVGAPVTVTRDLQA